MSAERPHLRHRSSASATAVGALGAQIPEQATPVLKIEAVRAMEHANSVDVASDLISIARCRELMGDEAEGLSDQDVDLIRRHA